jgi:hypothetical protein
MGRIESNEILKKLGPAINLEKYIQESIIPRMDQRRGRAAPLSRNEVVEKLLSIKFWNSDFSSFKPGEMGEALLEIKKTCRELTTELAAEIADIVYYTSQTNCPDFLSDPTPFFEYLGVDYELARRLCILKYETRINYGDNEDHKETEYFVLEEYLRRLG